MLLCWMRPSRRLIPLLAVAQVQHPSEPDNGSLSGPSVHDGTLRRIHRRQDHDPRYWPARSTTGELLIDSHQGRRRSPLSTGWSVSSPAPDAVNFAHRAARTDAGGVVFTIPPIKRQYGRSAKSCPPPCRLQDVRLGRDCQAEYYVLRQRLVVRRLEAETVQHSSQVEPHGGLRKAAPRATPVARTDRYEGVVCQRAGQVSRQPRAGTVPG